MPNCRDDRYLKMVKELISEKVLGSPGSYPIILCRWTRMGQARDESLERLLQLGEAEAIVAVLKALPDSGTMLHALLVLSAVGEAVVNPVFSRSDAIGTLMRKKLEPVFKPLRQQIKILTSTDQ